MGRCCRFRLISSRPSSSYSVEPLANLEWRRYLYHTSKYIIYDENRNTEFTNPNRVLCMTRHSQVEPALWLWAPDDGRDRPWRKFQHLYWPLPFSLTFALWRIDSVRTAIAKKLKLEVRLLSVVDTSQSGANRVLERRPDP